MSLNQARVTTVPVFHILEFLHIAPSQKMASFEMVFNTNDNGIISNLDMPWITFDLEVQQYFLVLKILNESSYMQLMFATSICPPVH